MEKLVWPEFYTLNKRRDFSSTSDKQGAVELLTAEERSKISCMEDDELICNLLVKVLTELLTIVARKIRLQNSAAKNNSVQLIN